MLNLQDFLALAQISRATYFNLRKQGRGPVEAGVTSRIQITRQAADAWLAERSHASKAA